MNCPKYGTENSDNVQECDSCGVSFSHPPKARTSWLAVLSLVLGILSLFLFVVTGIPAIVVGIISYIKIKCSGGTLRGKTIALVGMSISIAFMSIFFWLWSRDAPPIPNDYTIADLRSAPASCAESFEILKTLIDEDPDLPGIPLMGLTERDVEMIDEITEVLRKETPVRTSEVIQNYAKDVEHAWSRTQKARVVISQLNEFTEIADLTEPNPLIKSMHRRNLVRLVRLYQAHAHLLTEQEDICTFVAQLIELDSVIRKIHLNVRPFMGRLVSDLCVTNDIRTANIIANNPATSSESIELLAEHFAPLTAEQMSLRNCALFEYLFTKSFAEGLNHNDMEGYHFLFKKNSALRWYKNLYDVGINSTEENSNQTSRRLSVWPSIYPFKEPALIDNEKPLPFLYTCYNPEGSRFIRMFRVPFKSPSLHHSVTTIWIRDDLLQIVLNKRLGRQVSLKARAYSDEYIVYIKNKKIFSPGPDGIAGTKDDIKLSINPEVLGWSSKEK